MIFLKQLEKTFNSLHDKYRSQIPEENLIDTNKSRDFLNDDSVQQELGSILQMKKEESSSSPIQKDTMQSFF